MSDDLPLFQLPGVQEGAAAILGQQNGTVFLLFKLFRVYDLLVDAGEHEPVRVDGTQFLHQVQRQAAPSGAGAVQEAYIRVQPDPFQRDGTVVGQQGIRK